MAVWMRNCLARRHTSTVSPGASSLTLARYKMHTGRQQQPLNNMNFTMFQHSKPDKYRIQPCLKSLTVDELNVMVTFSRLALQ